MRSKVLKWYSDRYYPITKMLNAGVTWGFTHDQVIDAMEHCHNKIAIEGKQVHDYDVARYVKNVCIDNDGIRQERELRVSYDLSDKYDEMLKRDRDTKVALCVLTFMVHALMTLFYVTLS